MKQRLARVIAALVLGGLPLPSSAQTVPVAQYLTCHITSGAAKVCASGQFGQFVGAANEDLAAQTVTFTCYDNAAAASGTIVAAVAALGATQVIAWPAPGKPFYAGLTCQATGSPTGGGIDVYYRVQ